MSAQRAKSFYFAILSNNPNNQFKFTDVESMRNFLIDNPKVNELFHTDLLGIKIEYDTETGKVDLSAKEESQSVKNSFARTAFEKKISEVERAICRFAKHELLRELCSLNDPKIAAILEAYKLKFDGEAYNSSIVVDRALAKIKHLIKPKKSILFTGLYLYLTNQNKKTKIKVEPTVHYAVYLAFKKHRIYKNGIDHINSMRRVSGIMQTIHQNLPKKKPSKKI